MPDISSRLPPEIAQTSFVNIVDVPSNEDKLQELIEGLPKDELFSNFVPSHKKIAQKLVSLFLGKKLWVYFH